MQGKVFPERIHPDALVEALVEFRFEHAALPELVLGRLLDAKLWDGYAQARLPAADIPQPIREMDPNLRYQPLVELRKDAGGRVAKVGGHVLSYHTLAPYPGWAIFRSEIETTLREVIKKLELPQFSRIGLRYINLLRSSDHHIRGLADTNIAIMVGDKVITESVIVNYTRTPTEDHISTVKIATPDLVIGNIETDFSLLCDIDIGTKPGVVFTSFDDAMAWIEKAHTLEKSEFFSILPAEITEKLNVKSGGDNDA